MMRTLIVVMLAILFSGLSMEAAATEIVGEAWRSRYLLACSTLVTASNDCTLCHTAGGSSSDLNPYAEDIQFFKYDQDVLWLVAVEAIEPDDSDGDGVINEVEIRTDCTLPGDPLSVPNWEQDWSQIKALYR